MNSFERPVSLPLIRLAQCKSSDCGILLLLTSSSSIEELLRNKYLSARLALIDAIRQAAPESDETKVIQEWCSQQLGQTLASYVSADVSDVSVLISIACKNGLQAICQV